MSTSFCFGGKLRISLAGQARANHEIICQLNLQVCSMQSIEVPSDLSLSLIPTQIEVPSDGVDSIAVCHKRRKEERWCQFSSRKDQVSGYIPYRNLLKPHPWPLLL